MPYSEPLINDIFESLLEAKVISQKNYKKVKNNLNKILDFIPKSLANEQNEEAFWEKFQTLFAFSEEDNPTPMNAANLCPEPEFLLEINNLLRDAYNANVSQQTRMVKEGEDGIRVRQIQAVRKLLAKGIGLDPNNTTEVESVAILRNSSEANNAISTGIRDWAEGDNVVIWVENHPTNKAAWDLEATFGSDLSAPRFEIKEVSFDQQLEGIESDQVAQYVASAFTQLIDENTRVVTYSQVSNGSGFRIPDEAMRLIMEYTTQVAPKCHIHVDGTMIWGARAINVNQGYYHSICSSAHKWFVGPKETALLWMQNDHAQQFCPSIYAYDYKIEILDPLPDNTLRFELLGQRDDVNIITLAATQIMWDALNSVPVAEGEQPFAYRRVEQLADYLVDSLVQTGWEFQIANNKDCRWGVVRVIQPSKSDPNAPNLYDYLYEHEEENRNQIFGSGDDATFRLCPHIYNTIQDLDDAVFLMNDWKTKYGAN